MQEPPSGGFSFCKRQVIRGLLILDWEPLGANNDNEKRGSMTARTKLLAYLGQLQSGEWVPAKQLCEHLHLRYPTVKNTLKQLEEVGVVKRKVVTDRLVEAYFQLNPTTTYIPPEWEDNYGVHPSGKHQGSV